MDNFDVKFEETLSAFNTESDSVIVIPQGGEGKIQSISVNGEEQPIVNKNVDIKVPTKTSQLENDSNFATTDNIPNVPNWALQPNKPSYSYSEITDKPTIPSKTSQLTNDSDFATKNYVNDQIGNIGEVLDTINADLSAI